MWSKLDKPPFFLGFFWQWFQERLVLVSTGNVELLGDRRPGGQMAIRYRELFAVETQVKKELTDGEREREQNLDNISQVLPPVKSEAGSIPLTP